jgi:hypothetical protein
MHGAIPLPTHVLYWLAQRLYLCIGLKLLMVTKSDEIMLVVSHNNSEQTVVLMVTVMMIITAVMTIYKAMFEFFSGCVASTESLIFIRVLKYVKTY